MARRMTIVNKLEINRLQSVLWLKITAITEVVNFVFHDQRRFRILRSLSVIRKPPRLVDGSCKISQTPEQGWREQDR